MRLISPSSSKWRGLGGIIRIHPALTISDVVHVVSTGKACDREIPDARQGEDRRGLFASTWDVKLLLSSISSGQTAGIL
jgi:hypothetical protein